MALENRPPIVPDPQTVINKVDVILDKLQIHMDTVQSSYMLFGNIPDLKKLQILKDMVQLHREAEQLVKDYVAGGGIESEALNLKLEAFDAKFELLRLHLRLDPTDTVPAPTPLQLAAVEVTDMTVEELAAHGDGADGLVESLNNHLIPINERVLNALNAQSATPMHEYEREAIQRIFEARDPNLGGILGNKIEGVIEATEELLELF